MSLHCATWVARFKKCESTCDAHFGSVSKILASWEVKEAQEKQSEGLTDSCSKNLTCSSKSGEAWNKRQVHGKKK